jgi:hypothetical protein
VSEQLGFPFWAAIGRFWEGRARIAVGDGDAGLAEMQTAMMELAQLGTGVGATAVILVLAESQCGLGHTEEALGMLALALAQGAAQGEHYVDCEIQRLQGEILLAADSTAAEGEALLSQAIATAHAQGSRLWELRAATSLARRWQRSGKVSEALALLAPRYAAMSEGLETETLVAAKALLDELDAARRDSTSCDPRP